MQGLDSGTALDMIKNVPVKCSKCGSGKLLVFFERKIDNCFATACVSCHDFQIYGKSKEEIDVWFHSHGIN